MWWACPAWSSVRNLHEKAALSYRQDWPPCLKRCGLIPESCLLQDKGKQEIIDLAVSDEIRGEQRRIEEEACQQLWTACEKGPYGEIIVDDRVVVWTDGACKQNQNEHARRAGVGAFWAHNHPFNVSEGLE